jgi:RNA polymerase sigma factor (TIGR02999 family)
LLPLVYEELRKLAAARMSLERANQTLQPTALVHEAYLRLVGGSGQQLWDGRRHFFAAAAEAMRRIVIDAARRRRRLKRGEGMGRVELERHEPVAPHVDERLLVIDECLDQLQELDPACAAVVKLRLYAGMSVSEAAESLGMSRTTAYQNWAYGRAWLRSKVGETGFPASSD